MMTLIQGWGQTSFFSGSVFGALNSDVTTTVTTVSSSSSEMSASATGVTNNAELITNNASNTSSEMTTTTNGTGVQTVQMYPYNLYINYAVPVYTYYDWNFVHQNALDLYLNGYTYSNSNLQQRLLNLAFTDFSMYSNYHGNEQKLEFRAGTGVPFQFSGSNPPVLLNFNPVIVTKTFAAP